jgi:hypothetical protein
MVSTGDSYLKWWLSQMVAVSNLSQGFDDLVGVVAQFCPPLEGYGTEMT